MQDVSKDESYTSYLCRPPTIMSTNPLSSSDIYLERESPYRRFHDPYIAAVAST